MRDVILTASLYAVALLPLMVGCRPAVPGTPYGEPQPAGEPVTVIGTPHGEHTTELKIEQPKVEPKEVEPNEVEPNEVGPGEVGPGEVGPGEVEPGEAEPNEVEPNEGQLGEAQPNEKTEDRNQTSDLRPPTADFHDKCAEILSRLVDDNGMVNYKMLKRKRSELRGLLNEFAVLESSQYNSWPKEDKIAFWINAYNIQMLNIIVSNYPIQSLRIMRLFWPPTSIRHIEGIWSEYKFIVMDEEFTLSEIDRRLFRKEFAEPKVFFAISYASVSGPSLRNEPYYGRKLAGQLDEQVKEFLSSPRAFVIDRKKQKVYLSAILKPTWYGQQFISRYGTDKKFKDKEPAVRAVLNFATNYIPQKDVSFLETGNYSVEYIAYDWRLNE